MTIGLQQLHDLPKPPWIRVRLPGGEKIESIRALKNRKRLNTVCESALCPNVAECWDMGHATFMIMGDGCTRKCRFCGVSGAPGGPLAGDEPRRVAEAVREMGIKHAVITSVTRDDLPDGGAGHFAQTIGRIRDINPDTTIEALIPDFRGHREAVETVLSAAPDILGHNLETVPRLYPKVRPKADFNRSLSVLKTVKTLDPAMITKSGIMVGLGETMDEIFTTLRLMKTAEVDIMTIGQYLRPNPACLPVKRYYHPEEFAEFKRKGTGLGFLWVEAGPLVRSSYRAGQQARALCTRKKR